LATRLDLWHAHRVTWGLVGFVVAANAGAIVLAVLDRGVQSFVPTVMFTVATTACWGRSS
jgi:hypothetical protein